MERRFPIQVSGACASGHCVAGCASGSCGSARPRARGWEADLSFGKKGTSAFDPDPLLLQSPSDMVTDSKGRIVMAGPPSTTGQEHGTVHPAEPERQRRLDLRNRRFHNVSGSSADVHRNGRGRFEARIVAAGNYDLPMNRDIWVLRLKSDGHLDSGFGIGGGVGFDFGSFDLGYAAVVGKDGLIYVAASTGDGDSDKATVLRYIGWGSRFHLGNRWCRPAGNQWYLLPGGSDQARPAWQGRPWRRARQSR